MEKNKKYLIIFNDDDGTTRQSGGYILELNTAFVKFLDNQEKENIIPINRIFKIKELGDKE